MLAEKIIFNALASHTDVLLPGVGTLSVVRTGAAMKGREKLVPPRYAIVFHAEGNGGSPLPALIEAHTRDTSGSEKMYREWLQILRVEPGVPLPYNITIESVGEIQDGKFIIAPELDNVLNPGVEALVKLRPRLRNWHIIFIISLLVACGITAHYHYNVDKSAMYARREARKAQNRDREKRAKGLPTATQATLAEMEKDLPKRERPAPSVPAAAGANENTTAKKDAVQQNTQTAPAEKPQVQEAAPTGNDKYYVVLGVYSTKENAAKFISDLTSRDPSMKCTTMEMPTGKIMVSSFSSSSMQQAEDVKNKLIAKYPSVWVYKQK